MEKERAIIQVGKLLIAEPFMDDVHFKRALILICDHHSEGTLGFIINKSLNLKVSDLISDFPDFDAVAYYGGPVQNDTIHFVHTVGDLIQNGLEISKGVFWGGDFNQLKFLIQNELISPEQIRFYIGYTGWSVGQLRDEVEVKSWLLTEGDSRYVFSTESTEELWRTALRSKGSHYMAIADILDEPIWN